MFNPEDFENINNIDPDTVPDGIVDASDYHQLLKQITEYLEQTDYDDPNSRMVSMMNIINLYHDDEDTVDQDKVYGVTIGLMYHVQTMFGGMPSEDKEEYFKIVKEDILPTFEKDASSLPYYDSDFGGFSDE